MATRRVTVNDLLDGHVGLDLRCLDRIYLNGYLPTVQVGGQHETVLIALYLMTFVIKRQVHNGKVSFFEARDKGRTKAWPYTNVILPFGQQDCAPKLIDPLRGTRRPERITGVTRISYSRDIFLRPGSFAAKGGCD